MITKTTLRMCKIARKSKTDQHETENTSYEIVDQHRDLKVQCLFPVHVDLGSVPTLDQPNNERSEDVSQSRNHKPRQRAEMTRYAPGPDVPCFCSIHAMLVFSFLVLLLILILILI